MAKYRCTVCGYIYDEEKEGVPFEQMKACPLCKALSEKFVPAEDEPRKAEEAGTEGSEEKETTESEPLVDLAYDPTTARTDASCRYMDEIHAMAVSGESLHAAMGTTLPMPGWDDILILGAQLATLPLDDSAPVETTTVLGKNAKRPLVMENPIYVSHMSFGALSKEAKIALAKGSAAAHAAMCSGEGGILPEEQEAAYRYIFEYVPNLYSVTDENLRRADAIEIKIGQGTKPGMGGHLPGGKVTAEIAEVRGKEPSRDIQSPSHFADMQTREDLKARVAELRARSDGRPIGIKIAAGHIERDLEICIYAEPDFVTIDGRGGATGSSPRVLRDAASVPTVYALYRARTYLDAVHSDISLVITGGLRVSSDFAKALAMGADAVAVASGALIAAGCQQYRICGSGNCPVGIATQDETLRNRFRKEAAAARVANYLHVSLEEVKMFARITGHTNIHDLSVADLCTINREISEYTNIPHA